RSMNEAFSPEPPVSPSTSPPREAPTLGASSLYKLFEAFIALREKNERQHRLFEQSLNKARDAMQASFNSFAGDTQRAYHELRQEVHGEKRIALVLRNELLEVGFDLEHIAAARPPLDDPEAVGRWAEAVEVESRKVQAALRRHGIHPYDAVIGSPYNP